MWILFAHGAGAPSSSTWMQRYKAYLKELYPVETFDYDYVTQGRKRPDPLPKLIDRHARALDAGIELHGPDVILAGKSMGGRIGCHLALTRPVLGLVCFGYPLVGLGRTRSTRDQVLLQLDAPVLYVQGSRDTLCPLPLLSEVIRKRTARSELFVVESGDHSLETTKGYQKSSGLDQAQVESRIMSEVRRFVASLKAADGR